MRIRQQPSSEGKVVDYVQDGEIIEIANEQVGGYYKLTNGLGYCLATIPGVEFRVLQEF